MGKSLLSEIAEIEKAEKFFHTHKVPGGEAIQFGPLITHIHVPMPKRRWYFVTAKAYALMSAYTRSYAERIVVGGVVRKDRTGQYQHGETLW